MKEKNENGARTASEAKPWSKYEGRTTGYVIAACIVAATGGLIFGYDIGISGTSSLARYLIISLKSLHASCNFSLQHVKKHIAIQWHLALPTSDRGDFWA